MGVRYASSEEPREGDVVQIVDCYSHLKSMGYKAGDVDVVTRLTPDRMAALSYGAGSYASRFNLIARAGEPIRFQPGDVVECIESGMDRGYRVGAGDPGERFTVAPGSGVYLDFVGERYRGNLPHRFKLVRRPLAGPETETAANKLEAFRAAWATVPAKKRVIGDLSLRSVTPRAEGENVSVTLVYGPKLIAEQRIVVGSRVLRTYYHTKGVVKQIIGVDTPQGGETYAIVHFDGAQGYSHPIKLRELELTDDYPFTTEEN